MAQAMPATGARAAKLFRNNRSQAVRIPAEFEMPGTTVLIHKVGDKLIIEPEPKADLATILRSLSHLVRRISFPLISTTALVRSGASICER